MALGLNYNQTDLQPSGWVRPAQGRRVQPSSPAIGTIVLTFILLTVMIAEMMASNSQLLAMVNALGLRSNAWSWSDPASYSHILTYALLHGGPGHFFGNMMIFVLFGSLLEWRLGLRYAGLVFVAGAVVAGVIHLLMFPAETRPLIGASGAISALLGVALVVAGDVGLSIRIPGTSRWFELNIRRLLLIWMVFQIIGLVSVLRSADPSPGVAYWTHIASFGVGVAAGFWWSYRANHDDEITLMPSFGSAGD